MHSVAKAHTESEQKDGHQLKVSYRPINELKTNPKNPRRHDPAQIRKLTKSIKTFGFNVPVLIDPNGNVLSGHGRIAAAIEAGMTEVPTIRIDHLDERKAKAFIIADNRLAEIASWDDQLLNGQLLELSTLTMDFDLDAIGFETGEIDFRIEGLKSESQADQDEADALPQRPTLVTSRIGDLWLLGKSRILCANALDPESFKQLLGGNRAHLILTDPPFNVPIDGHVSGSGQIRHREFPMAAGEMSFDEFVAFLRTVFAHLVANSADGSVHFIFMDWGHLEEVLAAARNLYTQQLNLCVWVKENAGLGGLYRSQHEMVFVFKNGKARHRNNVQLGKHRRNRTNIWRYPGMSSISSRKGEEGNLLEIHPTVKPVRLIADAILDCSARGEIVLDPFLGSGSTLIAAARTGRRAFGLELDPGYVDTAIARWELYTGESARHAKTGLTFLEMRERRSAEAGGLVNA